MKFYDKRMYQMEQTIKIAVLIVVVFVISFILGYVVCNWEKQTIIDQMQTKINEQYIELDSLRESVYMNQIYGK